ncbi:flagellar protein FlgN [Undibacterium sp. Jales W-56]|uniref:flagella synthesis protein FlgN n=1 Tax=Undibacterium sp. Jales W-56 TaxID=2897325 RepID=UPI0021D0A0E6|nr:flagellar protein FlgN [Undibacterium sp. Jales W-56]MCU6433215.1 flagellar protein FlgN [Undibacterium sp. Jales W-56]
MNLSSAKLPQLDQCLQNELSAMTSLSEILKLEQAALIEGHVNDLNELTKRKGQSIAQVAELEKIRSTHLEEMGFSTGLAGINALLVQVPSATMIADAWTQLLAASEKAKEINRTNGILINRQLTRNQGALNILQQNNPAGAMYGPNGQAKIQNITGRGLVIG